MNEIKRGGPSLDLVGMMPALAGRPLTIIGTERGNGFMANAAANTARAAGSTHLHAET